jgi:hypothetical protein
MPFSVAPIFASRFVSFGRLGHIHFAVSDSRAATFFSSAGLALPYCW